MSVDCTFTDDDGACSTTYQVQGTGTKTGDTWTINATSNITAETPPGCSGDPTCEDVVITIVEQSTTAPTACQYGEANTLGAAVTGGPLGNVTMVAGGFPAVGTSGWIWTVSAFYNSTGGLPASVLNLSTMYLQIPEVTPGSLPRSFPISIQGFERVGLTTGGESVFMSYNEQYTDGGGFIGELASSGTLTVNEVSANHIAGSYSVNMSGTQYTPPDNTTPATRGVSGSFHVREAPIGTLELPLWPGLPEAIKMSRR